LGLQDLAKRERRQLQHLLRDVLQAVVDGDDPGRVVSAVIREASDALRDEQRQGMAPQFIPTQGGPSPTLRRRS